MARVLSVSSVNISLQKSNPPTVLVEVSGIAGTPGWKNIELVPLEESLSADGIFDLEFVGAPPEGVVIQVTRPVSADFIITKDVERIVGVMVHARTNALSQLFGTSGAGAAPSPMHSFAGSLDARSASLPHFTTFALGEESAPAGEKIPFETHPIHEKIPLMETMAIGESGPAAMETSPGTDIDRLVLQNQSFPGESIDDPLGLQRPPFGRR